jgi:hypothetical protein
LEEYPNVKFHENLSSESHVVPYGEMDGEQTNMTKLIVAFRNFGNGAEEHSRQSDLSKKILKYYYIA